MFLLLSISCPLYKGPEVYKFPPGRNTKNLPKNPVVVTLKTKIFYFDDLWQFIQCMRLGALIGHSVLDIKMRV